jgi:UDP-4-amino-4,6-dideoxy-N-acetyl-beta-L-altrosamine N-acetyltransferase
MKVTKYGVTLNRLTEDKIEQVRLWRNDPKISQYMEFQDYITPEMQKAWFKKIDNKNNYYFIIEFDRKEIGLINIRDIDYEKREGEGGIFIYDDFYLNSDVSFRSVLCLFDFSFKTLELNQIIAHILVNNKRAIQYNKLIGFKKAENQENILNQLYTLQAADFYKNKEIITRLF